MGSEGDRDLTRRSAAPHLIEQDREQRDTHRGACVQAIEAAQQVDPDIVSDVVGAVGQIQPSHPDQHRVVALDQADEGGLVSPAQRQYQLRLIRVSILDRRAPCFIGCQLDVRHRRSPPAFSAHDVRPFETFSSRSSRQRT